MSYSEFCELSFGQHVIHYGNVWRAATKFADGYITLVCDRDNAPCEYITVHHEEIELAD